MGFSLLELLVALALAAIVASSVWTLIVVAMTWARREMQQIELQQSGRIALHELSRMVRMAGRGGLGAADSSSVASGLPLTVRNNIGLDGSDRAVVRGHSRSPLAAAGSDILIVRGVFHSPVFVAAPADGFEWSPQPGVGRIRVNARLPLVERDQDLTRLREAVEAGHKRREAVVLGGISDDDLVLVAALDASRSSVTEGYVEVAFTTVGSDQARAYAELSSEGLPSSGFGSVAWVGILEEYRYYVREVPVGDPVQGRAKRSVSRSLSRARVYPGTEIPYAGTSSNLKIDVVDGIADLQVALGFDSPLAGGRFDTDHDDLGSDDRVVEREDGIDDDWLFNGIGDDPSEAPWAVGAGESPPRLLFCRLSVLAVASSTIPGYAAKSTGRLEDREYPEEGEAFVDGPVGVRYPRWVFGTTVGLRNSR